MNLSVRKEVTQNWIWVILGKAITLCTGFATNVILARLLSPQDLGVYFLLFSFVNLGVLISLLGMERTVVRMVSQLLALDQRARAYALIKRVLLLGASASVIIALLLGCGPGQLVAEKLFKSSLMSSLIGLAVLWIMLFTIQRLIAESFRGLHNVKLATIFNGLFGNGLIALALALLLFLKTSPSISDIITIVIVSYCVNVALSLRTLLRSSPSTSPAPDYPASIRSIVLETRYLYALSIMIFVLDSGHLWLLGSISDKESVAILGAIDRLMILITTGLFAMRLSISP
ncbi:MAG TPA: oligosaccharide flippase family protein, partial [Thermodesulfobacteriota bacterium]|nr:oligosaccharide flippase family protein [Thermodesulfobacteriota bacterium]